MAKYIDADKLKAEIERRIEETKSMKPSFDQFWAGQISAFKGAIKIAKSLQQEQPIEGKQVVIITETDGDANIHWDCRSLDDVKALLASAQSFIADKQVEESRGIGSGSDYNTTEGRFRNAHKFQQEQSKKSQKNCDSCPHCVDRKDQNGWHFKGCFGGPYKGKFVAEIEECPLQQEQPEVDLEKEIDRVIADYSFTKTIDSGGFKTTILDYPKIARHFYSLGYNARREK